MSMIQRSTSSSLCQNTHMVAGKSWLPPKKKGRMKVKAIPSISNLRTMPNGLGHHICVVTETTEEEKLFEREMKSRRTIDGELVEYYYVSSAFSRQVTGPFGGPTYGGSNPIFERLRKALSVMKIDYYDWAESGESIIIPDDVVQKVLNDEVNSIRNYKEVEKEVRGFLESDEIEKFIERYKLHGLKGAIISFNRWYGPAIVYYNRYNGYCFISRYECDYDHKMREELAQKSTPFIFKTTD